ncbi:unnamed protein product, partial [Protopolystoma xenopodis]
MAVADLPHKRLKLIYSNSACSSYRRPRAGTSLPSLHAGRPGIYDQRLATASEPEILSPRDSRSRQLKTRPAGTGVGQHLRRPMAASGTDADGDDE